MVSVGDLVSYGLRFRWFSSLIGNFLVCMWMNLFSGIIISSV